MDVDMESPSEPRATTQNVIGFKVTNLSFDMQIDLMLRWASWRLSKVVCVANVHMLIEGHNNAEMREVLHNADLVTPDGMPLVWVMRLTGRAKQERVAGMEILLALNQRSPAQNIGLFFLGSEPAILQKMHKRLQQQAPHLNVVGMKSLPFRPLTPEEDEEIIRQIHASGAGIVLVSLGCPKQELWMAEHKGKINAVMIGLGGVFPVYAGIRRWAPAWVRNAGLEWLYRLLQEPRRLWWRYRKTIPPFLLLAFLQIVESWRSLRLSARLHRKNI